VQVISRATRYGGLVLWVLGLLVTVAPSSAKADGGAPQLAYVGGAGQGVNVIDIAQQQVIGSIVSGGDPHAVLLSFDGSILYVTQPALGRISVIAAKTGKTLCTASLPGQPSLLALKLDGTVLYVAGVGDTSARALNPTTCAIERAFETHEPIYGLAVAASTALDATPTTPNQLWIAGTDALTVFEVNGHLLGTVPLPDGPEHLTIPGGFTAYITTRQGSVVAVDLNSRKIIGTLLRGGPFGTMDYDATTGEVYVPDQKNNALDVLLPVTANTPVLPQEPVRMLHLTGSPQSVAITSDGTLGFVALANGQVTMLDVPGRNTVANFAVGGTPHFIITGTYPPANSPATLPQQTPSSPISLSPLLLPILMLLVGCILLGALWLVWRHARKPLAGQGSQGAADKRL
jgi:DNA-binding beta-propeller fold protein YncE